MVIGLLGFGGSGDDRPAPEELRYVAENCMADQRARRPYVPA